MTQFGRPLLAAGLPWHCFINLMLFGAGSEELSSLFAACLVSSGDEEVSRVELFMIFVLIRLNKHDVSLFPSKYRFHKYS